MPPGRTPVETRVISDEKLADVVDGLGRHLAAGGQAYWVCPLVEESEKRRRRRRRGARARSSASASATDKVGLVHGRMKGPEKDAVMASFAGGELGVLVATTVIEVGVDVPNATLMIVEGAERFGLAQLHQLRGRVGRGDGREQLPPAARPDAERDGQGAPRADARDQRRLPHRRGGSAPARPRRDPRHAPVGRSRRSGRHARGRRRARADRPERRAAAARPRRRPGQRARPGGADLPLSVRARRRRWACSARARRRAARASSCRGSASPARRSTVDDQRRIARPTSPFSRTAPSRDLAPRLAVRRARSPSAVSACDDADLALDRCSVGRSSPAPPPSKVSRAVASALRRRLARRAASPSPRWPARSWPR